MHQSLTLPDFRPAPLSLPRAHSLALCVSLSLSLAPSPPLTLGVAPVSSRDRVARQWIADARHRSLGSQTERPPSRSHRNYPPRLQPCDDTPKRYAFYRETADILDRGRRSSVPWCVWTTSRRHFRPRANDRRGDGGRAAASRARRPRAENSALATGRPVTTVATRPATGHGAESVARSTRATGS